MQSCSHAHFFQRTLKSHAVDHGGQHSHVISLYTVNHIIRIVADTPQNISSANHDGNLDSFIYHAFYICSIPLQTVVINAEFFIAHQGFTDQLNKDDSV